MPTTYEPIATTTLGSATGTVTFSSISGTYTDLILVTQLSASTDSSAIEIRFNDDTASNYSITDLYGNGSSAGSARASNATFGYLNYYVTPETATTNSYNSIVNIMNYSNSTTYKTYLCRNNNAESGAAYGGAEAIVGLWRNTNAITKITLTINGTFNSGSTFTLYGIKSA
jgi:hypothetical protein